MDFKKIAEEIDIDKLKDLMEQLGAALIRETDSYLLYPTICHNENADEASSKLYFYKDKNFFMCYTECGGMSVFKFLEHYYETRNIDYQWHKDIYYPVLALTGKTSLELKTANFSTQPKVDYQGRYAASTQKYEFKEWENHVLEVFSKWYPPEWLNDGITKAAMDKFEIKFSISQNKIIIPHRSANGALIGIRARNLDPWVAENVGKYLPIEIENIWYNHPLGMNLYGLDKNWENIKKSGVAFIFEGEKSVLQAESFSAPNCGVAVCGSNLHRNQVKTLIEKAQPKEIIICFDNESENDNQYFNKLYEIGKRYSRLVNVSFIYDTKGRLKPKNSPTDQGEELFLELLNERVRIK